MKFEPAEPQTCVTLGAGAAYLARMRLVLASRSAGRAGLLDHAGVDFVQVDPPFDDPATAARDLRGTEAVRDAATGLAAAKLASLAGGGATPRVTPHLPRGVWVVAADTMCVGDGGAGAALGKPLDRVEAAAMLHAWAEAPDGHAVVTGVAMGWWDGLRFQAVQTFAETAYTRLVRVGPGGLSGYLDSGDWRGRSGGYDVLERRAAGWEGAVRGSVDVVVGLPVRAVLERAGATSHPDAGLEVEVHGGSGGAAPGVER